jgi:rhodanese-related sulfurtransferase
MTSEADPLPLEVGVHELAALRAEGIAHTILDVREPWEVEICGFEGALAVPLGALPGRLAEIPVEHPLIVVCHIGQRSLIAADFLRRVANPTARSLRGGVEAWAVEIEPEMPRY